MGKQDKSCEMNSAEAARRYMNGEMSVDDYVDFMSEKARRPAKATETLWAAQARQERLAGFIIGMVVGGIIILLVLFLLSVF